MLGRLGMSVDECIAAYEKLAQDVFGTKVVKRYEEKKGRWQSVWGSVADKVNAAKKAVTLAYSGNLFDAAKLRDVIKGVVAKHSGDGDAKMIDASSKCKV
jgi:hypothetical protein